MTAESQATTPRLDLPQESILLSQGAEARVFISTLAERKSIVKERFVKTYRHPSLDAKLNSHRVSSEARALARARRLGLDVPAVYLVEKPALRLWLEYIEGSTLKSLFDDQGHSSWTLAVACTLGHVLSTMHSFDLIHGDLTTSNVLLRSQKGADPNAVSGAAVPRIVLIDFGLSSQSSLAEDKAVDLYVLERAFLSTHPKLADVFAAILAAYGENNGTGPTLQRLELVRQRGRKKLAFG
jgi:TP53 regulating kinase-like protein